MALEVNLAKVAVSVELNNGLDAEGNIKTVTQSMPAISTSAFSDNPTTTRTAILNVIEAAANVFAKSIYRVKETQTSYIDLDE